MGVLTLYDLPGQIFYLFTHVTGTFVLIILMGSIALASLKIRRMFAGCSHSAFVGYRKVVARGYGLLESWVDVDNEGVANIDVE